MLSLLCSYTAVFAFIGVVLVRLKIFNSPTANHTSLFEVVRWALIIIGLTLVLNSSASIGGSFICFVIMIVLIELMKRLLVSLYVHSSSYHPLGRILLLNYDLNYSRQNVFSFPAKSSVDTFKTQDQYEEDRQKYTLKEMQKLRNYYLRVLTQ